MSADPASSHPDPTPRLAARALSRGDLRLLLLSLLGEQPAHGYELIRQVEHMFGGVYKPSAGAVYPVLTQFQQQGWVRVEDEGGRKRYHATEAGRLHMKDQHYELQQARERVRDSARCITKAHLPQDVRAAMSQLKQALQARHGQWDAAQAEAAAEAIRAAALAIHHGRPRGR